MLPKTEPLISTDMPQQPIHNPDPSAGKQATLLEAFTRFKNITTVLLTGLHGQERISIMQEYCDLTESIPEMIKRESAFADLASGQLAGRSGLLPVITMGQASTERIPEFVEMNPNDTVEVQFSEAGKIIWRKHYAGYDVLQKQCDSTGDEGFVRIQLWVLMEVLGPHVTIGGDNLAPRIRVRIPVDAGHAEAAKGPECAATAIPTTDF